MKKTEGRKSRDTVPLNAKISQRGLRTHDANFNFILQTSEEPPVRTTDELVILESCQLNLLKYYLWIKFRILLLRKIKERYRYGI
jgi:hypothetical protein